MRKTYLHSAKKITCLLLSCGLILTSAGCGSDNNQTKNTSTQETETNFPYTEMDTIDLMADLQSGNQTGTNTGTDSSGSSKESVSVDDTFLQSVMEFSTRIFQQTNAEKDGDNLMISPISILTALSMTMNGAEGETRNQMLQTLFPNLTFSPSDQENLSDSNHGSLEAMEKVNQNMSSLLSQLPSSEHARLLQANSIWFRNDTSTFQVNRDFLQTNADYYQAQIYSAPFNEQTLSDINNWVSKYTEQKIPQILDQIPEDAIMYLINALSFDAAWETPYKENEISDQTFTNQDGSVSTVPSMHSEESLYLKMEHATGFIKPYAEGYSFAALLPEESLSLDEFIEELTGETLLTTLSQASDELVFSSIPKFTSDYEKELSEVLTHMGMELPFDPENADFRNLGKSGADDSMYISRVIHKTSISVDENGTRAGAATAVEIAEESMIEAYQTVYLNRPFVYLIIDQSTNLPIFMGTVTQLP